MIRFFSAHKRVSVIIFSWVAVCAFVLIPKWRNEPFAFVFFSALFVTLIASQLFWIPRLIGLGERFIFGKRQRVWLKVIVGVPICSSLLAISAPGTFREEIRHT